MLNKGSGVRVKRGSHSGSEKASILNSPFGHDLSRLMQNGSLELRDLKGSVSRKKKANCKSAADVGINSARSWKEGKSYSRSRVCTETGLMKKEFNLDKFKALFGKAEERRKHSEHSRMIGELPFKACSLTVAGLKKREATVSKKSNSKESHKGSICGKNSSRGVNNPSQIHISMIPMIPFKKSIVTNPNQGSAKSREIESHRSTVTPIIQDNLVLDTHHLRKHTPEIQYKDIAHTRKTHQKSKEKGVISKLRCIQSVAKGKSRERTKESLKSQLSGGNRTDLEDVKFLFSKKLSNMQKMSLLRLQKKGREESGGNPKSRRRRLSKERHVEVEEITRNVDKMNSVELARYVKDNRLPTRMSASDSNDTCPKLCRGNGSTDGMTNTNLQDDFDEDHDQSSFELRLRDESSQKKSRRLKRMDQDVDTPKKRTRRVSKKLFERERRKSFNEERARKRAEHELHCDLQPGHISMTSDVNGRGYSNPSQAEDSDSDSEGYIGGSQLQRSNSELLLRTMVSSSSNNTRIDHNEVLHKVERERASLIDYITRYTRTFKKVPKTTLQFYKVIKLIGKGSFGKVHLGIHLLTRKKVAIKCIDKQYILEEKAQNKIIQEVTILKGLSHRNIIKILEVFENRKYVFIVTDYAAKGDLLQFMKEHNIFRESKARGIVSQILNGLEYCHARGIIHRDVKLDNVLLDKDFRVKLCDFGVSRYMPKNGSVKERCGTPAYIAPEIIKNQGYSGFLADVDNFVT